MCTQRATLIEKSLVTTIAGNTPEFDVDHPHMEPKAHAHCTSNHRKAKLTENKHEHKRGIALSDVI